MEMVSTLQLPCCHHYILTDCAVVACCALLYNPVVVVHVWGWRIIWKHVSDLGEVFIEVDQESPES